MRRALAVLTVAAGIGLAAAPPSWAQNQPVSFYLGRAQTDTAFGLVPGSTMEVPVRLQNPNYNGFPYWYLTHVRVKVHFDPARVTVVGALPDPSALYTIDSFTPGSGVATVEASGYAYGVDAPGFRLSLQLLAGAADGAYLWLEPDSVQTFSSYSGYANPPGVSQVGQACHATTAWGDVDANGRVDSRDALITLSAAVGLPVTGFNLAMGDVDGDALANSRDALMMLSFAIGVSPGVSTTVNRTGEGVPDACPALQPPGETVVFVRTAVGGGVMRLDSLSTSPLAVTTDPNDSHPRLNATGTSLVFKCLDGTFNAQICRVDPGGTNRRQLTGSGTPLRTAPDWSPDGARIVYLQGGADSVFTMDSSGTAPSFVPTTPASAAEAAWSRDGTQLLYSNGGLWSVLVAPPYPVTTINGSLDAQPPLRWSPDGQTVAFRRLDGRLWTLPAAGGASPTPLTWFADAVSGFDWGPQGVILSMPDTHRVPSLWLLQGGPGGPLVRLTGPGQSDVEPSFRRNP
jgi:hypothetical protein